MFFCSSKVEKNYLKKLHTYGSWEFFSAALTAQNSPKQPRTSFPFSFIQSSLLRSLEKSIPGFTILTYLQSTYILFYDIQSCVLAIASIAPCWWFFARTFSISEVKICLVHSLLYYRICIYILQLQTGKISYF